MRLPLKFQVALAPALIIVLLLALIVYLQYELNAIRAENEAVREWTRVVETAGAAVGGAVNLDQVASIEPLDSGDARVHLVDGGTLPVSRRYREALRPAAGRNC